MNAHTPTTPRKPQTEELRVVRIKDTDEVVAMLRRVLKVDDRPDPVIE